MFNIVNSTWQTCNVANADISTSFMISNSQFRSCILILMRHHMVYSTTTFMSFRLATLWRLTWTNRVPNTCCEFYYCAVCKGAAQGTCTCVHATFTKNMTLCLFATLSHRQAENQNWSYSNLVRFLNDYSS